jgi:hypothetical protein
MAAEAPLLIEAARRLMTDPAHAFVLVSKELHAWKACVFVSP